MNRRSFFGRVFGGVAAVVVAPFLPKLTPKPKPTLWETFIKGDISRTPGFDWYLPIHKDQAAIDEISARYVLPALKQMGDDMNAHVFALSGPDDVITRRAKRKKETRGFTVTAANGAV